MNGEKKNKASNAEEVICEGSEIAITPKRKWKWSILAAVICLIMAISWPLVERQFYSSMQNCPSTIKRFVSFFQREDSESGRDNEEKLRVYSLKELQKYDGTDPSLPILLAVGGKVLDVTTGSKFYAVGKSYHLFAGTACTRALVLSSLDKEDISDKVDDFNEEQRKELQSTMKFYYEKYPTVGVLEDTIN